MPELLAEFASDLAGKLTNLLGLTQGLSLQDEVNQLVKQLQTLVKILYQLLSALFWLFEQQHAAWQTVAPVASDTGQSIAAIANDQDHMWDRLVNVILPNSLQAVKDDIGHTNLGPLTKETSDNSADLAAIKKELAALEAWKTKTADPDLASYEQFDAGWVKTFAPAVTTLVTWLTTPAAFGRWAATPILAPLVKVLGGQPAAGPRNTLSLLLVNAWQSEPDDVLNGVLAWLVAG
jgi:hypothetical protein